MTKLCLTPAEYADRVRGGWLGKNVGTTLGAPFEGRKDTIGVSFYDPVPLQPTANDDLDLELLWLHALEEHGIGLTSLNLAGEWLQHMRYPWDEYGCATRNLRRGLNPPLSGSFDNWFHRSMGATIRAEIWGMIAPGAPDVAAEYAYQDAVLDHAGDGVWALVFLAALESAAFFVADVSRLIDIGLARIPRDSRITRAVLSVRAAQQAGDTPLAARARVLKEVGEENVTDAAQNLGFIALGLLYGAGDLGASVCTAVNCGYDTDTTGATVGSILGIITGARGLPARWLEPIGDAVVVGWGVTDLPAPATIDDLTARTIAIGQRVVAERCPGVAISDAPPEATEEPDAVAPVADAVEPIGEPDAAAPSEGAVAPDAEPATVPEEAPTAPLEAEAPAAADVADVPAVEVTTPPEAPESAAPDPTFGLYASSVAHLWERRATTSPMRCGPLALTVDYGDYGPVVAPGQATTLVCEMRNDTEAEISGRVEISAPSGWRVAVPGAQGPTIRLAPGRGARLGYVVRPDDAGAPPGKPLSLVFTSDAGETTTCPLPLLGASCWWFVGPLKNVFEGGFEHAFPIEDKPGLDEKYLGRGDGLVGWQRMAFREHVMDLEPIFNGQAGVAYGVTTLHTPLARAVRVIVHTNDGAKVWLDGRSIYQVHAHEEFRPTLCSGPGAEVTLRAGDNRLMVKIVRCGEPCRFALSIVDPEGNPVDDLAATHW